MVNHVDRKCNEIIFKKCVSPRCSHCTVNPVVSKKAWEYLTSIDFNWPNPMKSEDRVDHYMTYIEMQQKNYTNYLTGKESIII